MPKPRPHAQAPKLFTARLRLHPLCVTDAEEMFGVLDAEQLHRFTGGRPLELEELRERYRVLVRGHSADHSQTWMNWVVRLAPEYKAAGTVQATITQESGESQAEIAWVVGVPWQGQGVASEADDAMFT